MEVALDGQQGGQVKRGKECGIVAFWNEGIGMGFISPRNGGVDFYVHKTQLLDGPSLPIGAEVTFQATYDAQTKKPVALKVSTAPVSSALPDVVPVVAPQSTLRLGTVSAWVDDRGMGFIAPADGGQDFFCDRSALVDGGSLSVGSQVAFESSWDTTKNAPVAVQVSGAIPRVIPQCGPGSNGFQLVGSKASGSRRSSPYGNVRSAALIAIPANPNAAVTKDAQPAKASPSAEAKMSFGTVSSWIEERGMGFITPRDGGPDLFVHRSNLIDGGSLEKGDRVQFEACWDEWKKKAYALRVSGASPQAAEIQPKYGNSQSVESDEAAAFSAWGLPSIETSIAAALSLSALSAELQGGIVAQTNGAAAGIAPTVVKAGFEADSLAGAAVQRGSVSMWFQDRGLGYIKPTAGGDPCFVQKDAILEEDLMLYVGLEVTFQAMLDPATNKPLACNVRSAASGV